jgi:hypothetical protein
VFAYQPSVVDVEFPAASAILGMGKHTGPALFPAEADAVLAWLQAEHEVRVPDRGMPVAIGPVTLALGTPNTVDLGLGATLRFVPVAADGTTAGTTDGTTDGTADGTTGGTTDGTAGGTTGGLSLTGLELTAGAGGLHVVHPLFTSNPAGGDPRLDTADTFGDVDLDLAANAVEPLGDGAALFPAFAPTDPITLHFRTLEAP